MLKRFAIMDRLKSPENVFENKKYPNVVINTKITSVIVLGYANLMSIRTDYCIVFQ